MFVAPDRVPGAFWRIKYIARPSMLVGCLWLVFVCLSLAESAETILRPTKLMAIDTAINQAIAEKCCPGGVLWLEHHGASYHKAYGNRALLPSSEPMTEDT